MNNLTIILTLKGRKNFTERWLDWMSLEQCPYKIFLADGDEDKSFTKELIAKNKYHKLNLVHLENPHDKDILVYMNKVSNALNEVQTRYVVMADNDDFLIINNLKKAVDYFEQHQAIGTLSLPHFRFSIQNQSKEKIYSDSMKNIKFQKLRNLDNNNLYSNDDAVRLFESIKTFPSDFIYYGLHKTENFKIISSKLTDVVIDDLLFFEWFITYGIPLVGTIYCPEKLDPFVVRQEFTSTSAGAIPKLSELILRPNWSNQLASMRRNLSKIYYKNNPESELQFEKKIDEVFLEMMMMVNTSAKLGSYFKSYKKLYLFLSKIYLNKRGKGRLDLKPRNIPKIKHLFRLSNFLLNK